MHPHAADVVRRLAVVRPRAVALEQLETGESWTFDALHRRACELGGALRARGLAPGDRVLFVAENSVELAAHVFGAWYAGLIVVPCSVASPGLQLLDRARASGALVAIVDGVPAIPGVDTVAIGDLPPAAPLDEPLATGDEDAAWLFTSGTTGTPRVARIGHASIVAHAAALADGRLGLTTSDRTLLALPLAHSYGLRVGLLASFHAGATVVAARRFDTHAVASALRDRDITFFPAVPTMLSALGRLAPLLAPRLRIVVSAGAALADRIRDDAERTLGQRVREGYGLTEATFCTLDVDPPTAGTVGPPVPGVEVCIVDTDDRAVPVGDVGEVCVRGPNLMTDYVGGTPGGTFVDGFLRTGDLGRLDTSGRLVLVDRKKDVVVTGGFNVVPAVVEATLVAFAGVRGALVVGLPDAHRGEIVAALLEAPADLDLAALSAYLAQRLSANEVPRRVGFVESLPVGPSGKALRRAARELLAGETVGIRSLPHD